MTASSIMGEVSCIRAAEFRIQRAVSVSGMVVVGGDYLMECLTFEVARIDLCGGVQMARGRTGRKRKRKSVVRGR